MSAGKGRKESDGERFVETTIAVRFHEVDSYDVVWHGHYVAWLEVGRADLARRGGFDEATVRAAGYLLPVVSLRIDYRQPARMGDDVLVRTRLREPVDASFVIDYEVRRGPDRGLLARAETRQVVLNRDRDLLVTLPALLREAARRVRGFHRERTA